MASVTSQLTSAQQALQELQAEFGTQSQEQSRLKAQLEVAQSRHTELEAAKSSEAKQLAQQLAVLQQSVESLKVGKRLQAYDWKLLLNLVMPSIPLSG